MVVYVLTQSDSAFEMIHIKVMLIWKHVGGNPSSPHYTLFRMSHRSPESLGERVVSAELLWPTNA